LYTQLWKLCVTVWDKFTFHSHNVLKLMQVSIEGLSNTKQGVHILIIIKCELTVQVLST